MTYAEFDAQVKTLVATFEVLKSADDLAGLFRSKEIDYSLDVCECAAMVSGVPSTFVKLFNREFREAATKTAFDMALA